MSAKKIEPCTNPGCKGQKRPLYYRGTREGSEAAPFVRAGTIVYCPECSDMWDLDEPEV